MNITLGNFFLGTMPSVTIKNQEISIDIIINYFLTPCNQLIQYKFNKEELIKIKEMAEDALKELE